MSHPGLSLAVFLAVALVLPAAVAQPLRSVVVGGDAQVAVPPRGAPVRPVARPLAAAPAPPAPMPLPVAGAGFGLSTALPVLLPVAAALLLGAGSPGSGGSAAAPARTR
jgi:hypothetical protein